MSLQIVKVKDRTRIDIEDICTIENIRVIVDTCTKPILASILKIVPKKRIDPSDMRKIVETIEKMRELSRDMVIIDMDAPAWAHVSLFQSLENMVLTVAIADRDRKEAVIVKRALLSVPKYSTIRLAVQ